METFRDFKYGLYAALFFRLAIPTVYQTFRVSLLGSLPDPNQLNVASQMSWVGILLEIIEETTYLILTYIYSNFMDSLTLSNYTYIKCLCHSHHLYTYAYILSSALELSRRSTNLTG